MKYKEVKDVTYKGYEISVFKNNDNKFTVDVKTRDGELIQGTYGLTSFRTAMSVAKKSINSDFQE